MNYKCKLFIVNDQPVTKRYMKILKAMANGEPDKMIAHKMGKAHSTLDFHKSKLYKILNVQSKAQAVSEAYKHHLLCTQ